MPRVRKAEVSEPSQAPTHIALLRGINVGGKNVLSMATLCAIFEKAGCRGVRTYIQSGNVVFAAGSARVRGLADGLSKSIAKLHGIETRIIVRTAQELEGVASDNPFLTPKVDHKLLYVGFLSHEPDPERVAALDPKRSPGDRFQIRGREVYMYLASGVAKSRLTNAWFDSALATTSTVRNWRTVLTLVGMTQESGRR